MNSVVIALLFALSLIPPAWAGEDHAPHGSKEAKSQDRPAEGEVRRIDLVQGRITLRHGAIHGLNMPPMTMVFRVQDPGMLDGLKPGDRIRFEARRLDGGYTVVWLEKSP